MDQGAAADPGLSIFPACTEMMILEVSHAVWTLISEVVLSRTAINQATT